MNKTEINLTPSAINKYIKTLLENNEYLSYIKIEGEISNFKTSSGNFYFSIKDDEGQVSCSMWKTLADKLDFEPKDGMQVVIRAKIYHNVKSGYFSFNVQSMKESGEGSLKRKFEALKLKLETMGLFNEENKQPLKDYYQKIALVTAPTSAAIKDMLTTIKRRNPLADVIIVPCIVQGDRAKSSIVKAIELVNEQNLADVMIVGRGGGSIEDLWAFNEEEVAIATYESKIPIVSCVGHETDTTIIDYVSDKRAPTPTAAAEFVTPNIFEWQEDIDNNIKRMAYDLKQKVEYNKQALNHLCSNQYFEYPFLNQAFELDNLTNTLKMIGRNQENVINHQREKLKQISVSLIEKINYKIDDEKKSVNNIHDNLDNLNPLSILSRGYSVTKCGDKIVNSISQVNVNDEINIELKDGIINTKVVDKHEK